MNQAHIDIFSDPVCPWCLVGLARLDQALAKRDQTAEIGITHHPFLLDANTPSQGEDVVAMLKRKYGKAPDEMWDNLEQQAASAGMELDMRKQKWRYPSQRALVLIMGAKEKSTQHALARAISHACYLDGLNIADTTVLQELGVAHGFSAQEAAKLLADEEAIKTIEANAKWAPQSGITGVPYFIFNNNFSLSGAQPETVFDAALDKALSMERVEA
ncbi:MAG: DsbA family oxidoreductase [Devosiaceae bacterium]|nr:DsbA family oxidoreductase [Devosiaceae bacterium]